MSSHREHAYVWSWWPRDPAVGEELVFAAAAPHRADLYPLCRRVRIAAPDIARRLRPGQSGFTAALGHPDALVWMPLERFAARSHIWFDEEQLAVARRGQPPDHPADPARRPGPGRVEGASELAPDPAGPAVTPDEPDPAAPAGRAQRSAIDASFAVTARNALRVSRN